MTVQQERPAVASPPAVRVPEQRRPEPAAPPSPAPLARGWGSAEDRTTAMWIVAMMLGLGVFITVFLTLGIRVWA